ncbi:MAG: hypothetical protein IPM57_08755 [Oligoflexia bacterium]|nr:hypothetical protein [Oligoflexia bacterium]
MKVSIVLIFILTILATYVAESNVVGCQQTSTITHFDHPSADNSSHQDQSHSQCNINHCHLGHCGLLSAKTNSKTYLITQAFVSFNQIPILSDFTKDLLRPPIA